MSTNAISTAIAALVPLVVGYLSSDDFVGLVGETAPYKAIKRGDYAKTHADNTASITAGLIESGVSEDDAKEIGTFVSVALLNPGSMAFVGGYLGDILAGDDGESLISNSLALVLGDSESSQKVAGTFGAVGTPALPDANINAVALAAFMLLTQPSGEEMVKSHPLFTIKKSRSAKSASDSRPTANRFFHETVMGHVFGVLGANDFALFRKVWADTRQAQLDGKLDPDGLLPNDVMALGDDISFAQILSAVGRTVGSRIVTVTSPDSYPEYVALKDSGQPWRVDKDGNVRTGGFGMAFVYDGHRPDAKPRAKAGAKTDEAKAEAAKPVLVEVETELPSA